MRRSLPVALALLAAAVAAAPAAAAPTDLNLPKLFATAIPKVKARSVVPVLLPQTMPYDDETKLYTSSGARARAWHLDLASARGCHQATACFVAEFSATRRGHVGGGRRVKLRGGRVGRFRPLSCGASCSPPSIAWRQHGAAYRIQAAVVGSRSDRRILVGMADDAIRHGAR